MTSPDVSELVASGTPVAWAVALLSPSAAAALVASAAIMCRSCQASHTGWQKKAADRARSL